MPTHIPPGRFDSPWKAAVTHAFRLFILFFFADCYAAIDWSKRPRFLDKELESLDLDGQAAHRLADLLVEVHLRDGGKGWVLIHVEVQAQRDTALAERILDYNYLIFKKYRQPVASLVVLADENPYWRPRSFHQGVLGTEMGIRFCIAKLLDYADRMQELEASSNPFALVTLAHLRTQQARQRPRELYAAKWQLTRILLQHGWSKARIIILFRAINQMMALPAPEQLRYGKAVRKLTRERKMEWVDAYAEMLTEKAQKLAEKAQQRGKKLGMKEGLKEGREKGRAEGVQKGLAEGVQKGLAEGVQKGLVEGAQKGAAELLEWQLTQRFGPLPQTVRNKLAKASVEQLRIWSAALLDAQSMRQVFRQD